MSAVFWGLVRTAAGKAGPEGGRASIAETARAWGMIEAATEPVTTTSPVPSSRLCDIPWGVHAHRWFGMDYQGLTRPEMPALRAWYDRLCQRPAYQQHVMATPIT